MTQMKTVVVWLKRHLRDYALLHAAQAAGAAAALFVIKPAWLASAEFNASQLPFSPRFKLF